MIPERSLLPSDQLPPVDGSVNRDLIAVEKVRSLVEACLQDVTDLSFEDLFQPPLTTVPEQVHPLTTSKILRGGCISSSNYLRKNLRKLGVGAELVSSATTYPEHYYLQLYQDMTEVLIDPTIGQYLDGHNHVFVGTRRQLKDLVVNPTRDLKGQYNLINTVGISTTRVGFFEQLWGDSSNPAPKSLVN